MPTDPLECFIQELQDLSTMNGDNGPDISAALDDLPAWVQQRGEVARKSMQEAVEACCLTLYIICYIICNNRFVFAWAGYLQPPWKQDSTAFTKSKCILMDYQKLKMMSVQDIKDLIKDVLHNKDFHPDWVDDNMHEILYIISYMISYCWNYIIYYII